MCKRQVDREDCAGAEEHKREQLERPNALPAARRVARERSWGRWGSWSGSGVAFAFGRARALRLRLRRRVAVARGGRVREQVREDRAESDLQEAARHEREERAGQSRVGAHQTPERHARAWNVRSVRVHIQRARTSIRHDYDYKHSVQS